MLRTKLFLGVSRRVQPRKFRAAGDIAQRKQEWAEAIKLYRRFLKTYPHDAAIWVQVGHAHKELKQFEEAETAYRKAMIISPADDDAALHLSAMLHSLGRGTEALGLASSVGGSDATLDAKPNSSQSWKTLVPIHANDRQRGDLARKWKDWSSAAIYYSSYLRQNPREGRIWTQLGHMLKEENLLEDALYAYQVAKRLESTSSDVTEHLNALLIRMGRRTDAVPTWADMFNDNVGT